MSQVCIKCGQAPANKDVIAETGKAECVSCCIKGYRFVLRTLHSDISKLELKLIDLRKEKWEEANKE